DDPAAAVLADGRQGVDGAFEAVEGVPLAILHHLEGLVVLVPAHFTPSHDGIPPVQTMKSLDSTCKAFPSSGVSERRYAGKSLRPRASNSEWPRQSSGAPSSSKP